MSAELIRAMEAFGIIVDREPRMDGTVCRYRMAGKKSRSAFVIAKELDGKKVRVAKRSGAEIDG